MNGVTLGSMAAQMNLTISTRVVVKDNGNNNN